MLDDELLFWPATRIARAIREREVCSREVVELHLRRIEAVNPKLNAVITLAADRALAEAAQADDALARGETPGALHGMPVTIKDSFDTQGIVTTAGTVGRTAFIPAEDATVVARLRAAGAIVLGKTNTPEFTVGGNTVNLLFGRTSNPYDPERSTGGSSGGAAAIVAAGGSPLDVGSDTGGSIREPAHYCGVAGLKPTLGRVPRTGHAIPPAVGALGTLTQVGPIARFVDDLALTLPVLSGVDWRDPTCVPMPVLDHTRVDLGALRVAFFTRIGDVVPEPAIEEAVTAAASTIAAVEDLPEPIAEAGSLYARFRRADGGGYLRRLLARAGTIEPGPIIARQLQGATAVTGAEFSELAETVDDFRGRMLAFLEHYDAIICPPAIRSASRHGDDVDDPYQAWVFASTFNLTGWPAGVVRAGSSPEDLPVAVQIVGRPWREEVVLAVAALVESRLGGYRRPEL